MRIAISGPQNTGKTTLVKDFLSVWPMYRTTEKTYRDIITEKSLSHSSKTTVETQDLILDWMLSEHQKTSKNDNIVFDRCPLDNLMYSLWAHLKDIDGFTKDYIDNKIAIVKEAYRYLDIVFFVPWDGTITVVEDKMRDTDVEYIKEINHLFESMYDQYTKHAGRGIFFPKDDCPAFIKITGSCKERIEQIQEYVQPSGQPYGDEHSIFNPENLSELEKLVRQQKAAKLAEEKERDLFKKFGL